MYCYNLFIYFNGAEDSRIKILYFTLTHSVITTIVVVTAFEEVLGLVENNFVSKCWNVKTKPKKIKKEYKRFPKTFYIKKD